MQQLNATNAQKKEFDYDIVIVGGGMVGGSLALALAKNAKGLKVALVEPIPAPNLATQSNEVFDARAIALSESSLRILEVLGLTPHLEQHLTEIKKIHISQQGYLGFSVLDAKDINLNSLGKCILAYEFGNTLYKQLLDSKVTLFQPARCESFTQMPLGETNKPSGVELNLSYEESAKGSEEPKSPNTKKVSARYLIAADGSNSKIRQALGIKTKVKDYDEVAILARVSLQWHHEHIAYERFLKQGVMALLPLAQNDMKLVITTKSADKDYWMGLDDKEFIKKLIAMFGKRLGGIERISSRISYPLYEVRPQAWHSGCVALIGNAAHSQHPIAGQGYNLGLRDVQVLSELATRLTNNSEFDLLGEYAKRREEDMQRIMTFTDGLLKIFSNRSPILAKMRGAGLFALNYLPKVRSRVSYLASGLAALEKLSSSSLPLK